MTDNDRHLHGNTHGSTMTHHDREMPVWTPALRFTVPGVPYAKQRPRFTTTRSGLVKTYSTKASKVYERSVAWHAKALAPKAMLAPAGVPVRVDILAQYPRPQRLRNAGDTMLPKCVRTHGDLDNHVKAVLDGLNHAGIWKDDGQVQCIRAEAVYAPPGTRTGSLITVFVPVSIANLHNLPTKDKTRELLEASASSTDTRTTDAQMEQG